MNNHLRRIERLEVSSKSPGLGSGELVHRLNAHWLGELLLQLQSPDLEYEPKASPDYLSPADAVAARGILDDRERELADIRAEYAAVLDAIEAGGLDRYDGAAFGAGQ